MIYFALAEFKHNLIFSWGEIYTGNNQIISVIILTDKTEPALCNSKCYLMHCFQQSLNSIQHTTELHFSTYT